MENLEENKQVISADEGRNIAHVDDDAHHASGAVGLSEDESRDGDGKDRKSHRKREKKVFNSLNILHLFVLL
jgi:hypothetical protein